MSIPLTLSGFIVVVSGMFCIGLALMMILDRARAQRFLMRFAGSARAHFTEQIARLCAGIALVIFSPSMAWSPGFMVFGWVLVITSVLLMLIPWRLHRRFAEWSLPRAFRHFPLYAIGSFSLGAVILYAALPGLIRAVSS